MSAKDNRTQSIGRLGYKQSRYETRAMIQYKDKVLPVKENMFR